MAAEWLVGSWRGVGPRAAREATARAAGELLPSVATEPEGRVILAFFLACPDAPDGGAITEIWNRRAAESAEVTSVVARCLTKRAAQGDAAALQALRDGLDDGARRLPSLVGLGLLGVMGWAPAELLPSWPSGAASPVDEHRRLIGALLDHDASEVFDKLEQLLDTAPQLGEALLLEMASRKMDLRGAIALLRDRVERDTLKGWILGAVEDELERLVYLAMI